MLPALDCLFLERTCHVDRYRETVQPAKRFRIQPKSGGADVFVHISAVERAGLSDLAEGQKLAFEVTADGRRGKSSADRLTVAA